MDEHRRRPRRPRGAGVLLGAALALAVPAPGAVVAAGPVAAPGHPAAAPGIGTGDEVSGPELEALARRAVDDPAARDGLRRVERVDGRPVELGRALGSATGGDAAARVRALVDGLAPPAAPESAEAARAEAGRILAQRRFRPRPPPRPLEGVLRRLGSWLRPVAEPLGRLLGRVVGDGRWTAVVALLVVVASAVVSARAAHRRLGAGGPGGRAGGGGRSRSLGAAELERQADEAERRGELRRAFRLRFRAGLVRLDDAGVIALQPSLTTGQLVRRIPSPSLARLARTFEEIVYGGRPAGPEDVEAARSGWPLVLREAGSR